MFMILFILFFSIPTALFFVGAVVLQSFHLFFGGLIMALAAAIFFVVTKVGAKKRNQEQVH